MSAHHRGELYRAGSGWGFRFSIRVNGERRFIRQQSKSWTRKEANQAMVKAMADADAGIDKGTSKAKVGDFLRSWIEAREKGGRLKATTLGTMRVHIERYLIPAIGEVRLGDLKPATIEDLYGDLLAEGSLGKSAKPAGAGLSPKSVRNIAGTLHKALADAVRQGVIAGNPADRVDLPRWDRPQVRAWDRRQVASFLAWSMSNDDSMFPIWFLLFSTGMRRGEILGLRWVDVDLVGSTVRIQQTRVVAESRGVIVSSPKSRAGSRVTTIDASVRDALAMLKDRQEAAAERLRLAEPTLVACDLDGRPISPQALSRRFQKAQEAAGMDPKIRLHDARHTHASILFHEGESIVEVSGRLGHSRVSTTLDVYAHLLPNADRELADRFGARLKADLDQAKQRLDR